MTPQMDRSFLQSLEIKTFQEPVGFFSPLAKLQGAASWRAFSLVFLQFSKRSKGPGLWFR